MLGSAYLPGSTGLRTTRASIRHVTVVPSAVDRVYSTGSVRSTVVPDAGVTVTPGATVNVGVRAAVSASGVTGRTTVRALPSTIGACRSVSCFARETSTRLDVATVV